MFFLGLISLLQIALLPGFLMLKLLRIADGFLKTVILSFAASLVVNYLGVFLLVVSGLYCPAVIRGLLALELLALGCLLWLGRRRPNAACGRNRTATTGGGFMAVTIAVETTIETTVETDWQRAQHLARRVRGFDLPGRILALSVALLAAWTIGSCVAEVSLRDVGSIFTQWDPMVSWNAWALAWAENRLPQLTYRYGQLIPANWSVSYVLIGDSRLQFFAKWSMSLFPLMILLAQLDLALRLRRPSYLLAVPLTGGAMWLIVREVISSGQADVPVAAMGFIACYTLIVAAQAESRRRLEKHVLVGALVAGGCLLSKQAGLPVALFYPLLVYLLVVRPHPALGRRRLPVFSAGLILAMVLPWYLYKEVQIHFGLDAGEFLMIRSDPDIHQGRSALGQLLFAVGALRDCLTAPVLLGLVPVGLLAALTERTWRWLLLLIVLPTFVIWALFFNYDQRNLALAIPFAATAVAVGFGRLARVLHQPGTLASRQAVAHAGDKCGPGKVAGLGVMILLAAAAWTAGRYFDDAYLLRRQEILQRSICIPGLNEFLYGYHQSPGFRGTILGNNAYIHALPVLREFYEYDPMDNGTVAARRIAQGDVRYLLVTFSPAMENYISEGLSAGRLKPIYRGHDHQLFEIAGPGDEAADPHPGVPARPAADRRGD